MNATTEVSASTLDQLRERLAVEEAEATEAEAALGAATLDSPNPKAASKRLTDAEAAVRRTEAALSELERREERRVQREAELALTAERNRSHAWIAEYLSRAERIIAQQRKLEAEEAGLAEHLKAVPNRLARHLKGLDRRLDAEVTEFDVEVSHYVPQGSKGRWPARTAQELKHLAVEACRDRAAHARELAAEEQKAIAELEGAAAA